MSDLTRRSWTGIFGPGIVALDLAMFALYTECVGARRSRGIPPGLVKEAATWMPRPPGVLRRG